MNFAPLFNARTRLAASAKAYDQALEFVTKGERTLQPSELAAVDRVLIQAEQTLTSSEGLPRRPWFRHQIYVPGFYTGYGVKTLPGVREGIEERKWSEAQAQTSSSRVSDFRPIWTL